MVFHLCEAHATSHFDQLLNHGYLAVDFFFALSGFVIGYAYDDRWGRMTVGGFFKRRLIRLQPMVVLGMAVGAALFYFQDCDMWPVHAVPVWKMLAVMLVGMTLLPGTIISTGTPSGVGMGFDPPKFLKPGDVVECAIEGIGTLRNTVR